MRPLTLAIIAAFGLAGCGMAPEIAETVKSGQKWEGMTEQEVLKAAGRPISIKKTEYWGLSMKKIDFSQTKKKPASVLTINHTTISANFNQK